MRIDIGKLGYTHYFVDARGNYHLFEMDRCENCGAEIQAANSMQLTGVNPERLAEYGLERVDKLPEQGYHSDKLGHEACYNCNG